MELNKETIVLHLEFTSRFWDRPPEISIFVNAREVLHAAADQEKFVAEFEHCFEFGKPNLLSIKRTGKSDDQCVIMPDGSMKDQILILDKVVIDGIDVQNLIWHRSWYEPIYPTRWQSEQEAQGISLESKILGETWWSHNGTWYFEFTSPFYRFVIDQFKV